MGNTVFVLGAGASRSSGAPLMGDFLDVAEDVGRRETNRSVKAAFTTVFDAYNRLRSLFSKTSIPLDNIEALFALIEMSALIGLPDWPTPEFGERLNGDIRTVIVRTLERTIQFPEGAESGPRVRAHASYSRFCEHCRSLATSLGGVVDFITFNYDVSLDKALDDAQMRYHYCLADGPPPAGTKLLKLHGSLNFVLDEAHGRVESLPLISLRFKPDGPGGPYRFAVLDDPDERALFVVPPSWNKAGYHNKIAPIWRAAGRVLAEAENIFVVGYSVPDSDHFFRYLFALASDSHTRIKRFWVYDPNVDAGVGDRFRQMLGPLVLSRFETFAIGFEEVPNSQSERLEIAKKRPSRA